jgi:tRNAThr (cytosine32-N3)-methyltransferase
LVFHQFRRSGSPALGPQPVAALARAGGLLIGTGTQALEDAAVLVFLENEISTFAAQHAHYPREKFVEILQKSWRKLSPAAQQPATGLTHSPAIADLIRDALA